MINKIKAWQGKIERWQVFLVGLGVVIVLYFTGLITILVKNPLVVKVEAQSPQRFKVQATETISNFYNLMVICDTATGNLLYTSTDYRSGMAVVSNSCAKNPR